MWKYIGRLLSIIRIASIISYFVISYFIGRGIPILDIFVLVMLISSILTYLVERFEENEEGNTLENENVHRQRNSNITETAGASEGIDTSESQMQKTK